MSPPRRLPLNRRQFLQTAGSVGALAISNAAPREISIVVDPADSVANAKPAKWAIQQLEDALSARGVSVKQHPRVSAAPAGTFSVVAAGATAKPATGILKSAAVAVPPPPESLAIVS